MASKYPSTARTLVPTIPHTRICKSQIRTKLLISLNQMLTPWPALVMAVENSFGGPDTKEKAEWLKEVVVDYILSKKLLDIDELEEYILNIMETEFNTLVDDGSCIKLCETILRVYTAIQLNDTLEIEQILSPFRLLVKSNVKTAKPVKESVIHEDTDEKTEICIVTQSERETTVLNTDFTDKCDDDMDVSGEWQIVTRSKKKKKKVSTSIMNI